MRHRQHNANSLRGRFVLVDCRGKKLSDVYAGRPGLLVPRRVDRGD